MTTQSGMGTENPVDASHLMKFSQRCINCSVEGGQHVNRKMSSTIHLVHTGASNFDQDLSILHALSFVFQIADKELDDIANCRLCSACSKIFLPLFQLFVQFNSLTTNGSFINNLMCRNNTYRRCFAVKQEKQVFISCDEDTQDAIREHSEEFNFEGIDDVGPISMQLQQKHQDASKSKLIDGQIRIETWKPSKELVIKLEPLDLDMISNIKSSEDLGLGKNTGIQQRTKKTNTNTKHTRLKSKASERIFQTPKKETPDDAFSAKRGFKCQICCETFQTKNARTKHQISSHVDHSNYFCSICQCYFKMAYTIRFHKFRAHSSAQIPGKSETYADLQCKICSLPFLNNYMLKKHIIAKHYQCPICDAQFSSDNEAKCHLSSQHGDESIKPSFICELCGFKPQGAHQLRRHKALVHSEGSDSYDCKVCGKKCFNSNGLRIHSYVHSEDRAFECDQCPMSFKSPHDLRQHNTIHSGIKYICDMCGFQSSSSTNLKKHVNAVHFGQKMVQKRNPMEQKKKRLRLPNAIKAVSVQEQEQNILNDHVTMNNENPMIDGGT